jgi:hypothetical protein
VRAFAIIRWRAILWQTALVFTCSFHFLLDIARKANAQLQLIHNRFNLLRAPLDMEPVRSLHSHHIFSFSFSFSTLSHPQGRGGIVVVDALGHTVKHDKSANANHTQPDLRETLDIVGKSFNDGRQEPFCPVTCACRLSCGLLAFELLLGTLALGLACPKYTISKFLKCFL